MGVDAATPPGLMERIRMIVAEEIGKFMRSGFLRNASISDGGLTIKGGFFRLLSKATGGATLFYLGPIGDVLGDGERQQFWQVRRADGSPVLMLWDAFPDPDGTLNQALSWMDRAGNVVFADDTDSGQGIARPWVPGGWQLARALDWPPVTSTGYDTVYRAKMPKQHPQLRTAVWGWADTPGTTGEVRVMVNGTQLGPTVTVGNSGVGETVFGPSPVAGAHMGELVVEVQARRTAGTGGIRCCPSTPPEGRQT